MTLAETLLAAALLAQVAWTFAVMIRAGRARIAALRGGRVRGDIVVSQDGWPEDVRRRSNNMNNQFETPTLFYALGLLALVLKPVTLAFALLAWVYVAARVAHSILHVGARGIEPRFAAFLVGVAALMIMTALLAVAVLVGRIP
jgi:hypothetical protein